jgi:hypothetical protein
MTLTSARAHSGGNCSPVNCFQYSSVELALITATLDASLDHLVGGQYDDPRMFNAGDPGRVAGLLDALRDIGADEAASVLATRAARDSALDVLYSVTWLLGTLRAGRAQKAVCTLAFRVAEEITTRTPEDLTDC